MKAIDLFETENTETESSYGRSETSEITQKIRHADIVQQFERCDVCAGKLAFRHRANWIAMEVTESGSCEDCGAKIESRCFRMN